jgi:hypothetical protein
MKEWIEQLRLKKINGAIERPIRKAIIYVKYSKTKNNTVIPDSILKNSKKQSNNRGK